MKYGGVFDEAEKLAAVTVVSWALKLVHVEASAVQSDFPHA